MPRRSSVVAAGVVAGAAGCALDRPDVLLICHNANCVEPTDPAQDDTIPALRASLALRYQDGPALDGVEVDAFWSGADDACLFAHDLDRAVRVPALDAAREVAAYLAGDGPATFAGRPFRVMIELKGHVGAAQDERHDPSQRAAHAACVWSMYDVVAAAAAAHDRAIEVVFTSFEAPLLAAVQASRPSATPAPYALAAIQGIPRPLDAQSHPLDTFGELDLGYVEVHPQWLLDGQAEAIDAADLELIFWSFDTTSEVFEALTRYSPAMVETSEAQLMRRWLGYR